MLNNLHRNLNNFTNLNRAKFLRKMFKCSGVCEFFKKCKKALLDPHYSFFHNTSNDGHFDISDRD